MDPHDAEAVAAIAATYEFYGEVDCLKKRKSFSKNSLKSDKGMYIQQEVKNEISKLISFDCHTALE